MGGVGDELDVGYLTEGRLKVMSKNNQFEQIRKHSNCRQRFALRKLSVGVASVLVGLTFAWGQTALASDAHDTDTSNHAETTTTTDGIANQQSTATLKTSQQTNDDQSNGQATALTAEKTVSTTPSTVSNNNHPVLNSSNENTPQPASENNQPATTTGQPSTNNNDVPATQYHTADWNVDANNTITLKTAPTAGSTVYVPNSFDFGHEVIITPDYMKQLSQIGVKQLFIDHRGNGTVKAQAGDWSGAFANGKWTKLDLTKLDTSEVTNMTALFQSDNKLTSVGNIDKWNTSNVTDMHGMFAGTNSLIADNGTLDIHDWDTSKVIAMNSMFDGSCSLTKIDVHGWNVSNVIGVDGVGNNGMDMMFRCSASIGGSTLAYTASKLQTVDISGWSNPDKLKEVGRMFMFDSNLQEVKGINEWLSRPNNIQSIGQMFRGCTKPQRLNLSKWNVTNLSNMGSAFQDCKSLQSLGDLSHWDTQNLQNLQDTFNATANFNDPITLNSFSHWKVGNLTNMISTFANSGITTLDLSNWRPHIDSGMTYTFMNCKNLTSLGDLSDWDMSNVPGLIGTFTGDPKLTSLGDLSNWDIHNVNNMAYTFSGDSSLTSLGDLSNWDTHNVNNLAYTFNQTPHLTGQRTADGIAKWDVSNVTNFAMTFDGCGLSKLDLHNWNTSKGTNFNLMFSNAGVKNLNLNGWDFSHGPVSAFAQGLTNPALITMNDVKLPTGNNSFKTTDFAGTKPLVVISDQLPLSLNDNKWHFNYRQSDGTMKPGPDITGRQNSNILTFVEKGNTSNKLGTKPMDFVFASNDDFEKAIEEATSESAVKAAIGNSNAAKWLSNDDLTDDLAVPADVQGKVLHTNYANAPASFPELVAGTYQLTMQQPAPEPILVTDSKSVTRTINFDVTGTGHAAIAPITQTITYTRVGVKDLTTGSTTWGSWIGATTFPAQAITQIHGFDSYVDGVKANQVDTSSVTFIAGEPQNGQTVTVSYKKQGMIPVPYDPAKDNMEMTVTRTIEYDVTGTNHAAISPVTQTVVYTRADAQGNAGYQDPVTGDITWNAWHVKDNGQAQFPAANVTQIAGFDSYVDGQKSTEVAPADVTEIDGVPQDGQTLTVTYVKQANNNNQGDNNKPVTPNHGGNNGGNTNPTTPNRSGNNNGQTNPTTPSQGKKGNKG